MSVQLFSVAWTENPGLGYRGGLGDERGTHEQACVTAVHVYEAYTCAQVNVTLTERCLNFKHSKQLLLPSSADH